MVQKPAEICEKGEGVQVARFSTDAYAAQDRFDAWREEHPLSPARFMESQPVADFHAETAWFALGARPYHYTNIAEQDWQRTARHLRDDVDMVVVNIRFSGGAHGEMGGRTLAVPGGSVVFTDFRQEQAHRSEPCSCLAVAISREEADAVAGGMDLHGLALMPDAARLIRTHALRLQERALAGTLRLEDGTGMDATLLHLLHAGIASHLGRRASRESALVAAKERVFQAIEDNLGSPTLTVGRLARQAGLSRSSLYRLFEEEDGVQAWIRQRRLERVAAILATGRRQPTIAGLADQWGFCDAAYLGRLFREAYGMTPGEYRARAAESRRAG